MTQKWDWHMYVILRQTILETYSSQGFQESHLPKSEAFFHKCSQL